MGSFFWIFSYSTVSAELFAAKQFFLDLYCIKLLAEPLSVADFALPNGRTFFFLDNACTSYAMSSADAFIVIHQTSIDFTLEWGIQKLSD